MIVLSGIESEERKKGENICIGTCVCQVMRVFRKQFVII